MNIISNKYAEKLVDDFNDPTKKKHDLFGIAFQFENKKVKPVYDSRHKCIGFEELNGKKVD